ncbi:MAG: DUF6794 domain-containing protein [Ignavibacteria bacterium]
MHYPKTIEEAVDILSHIMLDEDKDLIKNMSEDDLIDLQFGLGMAIRNNFGLWAENYELIADCKAKDADGASSVIIKAFWKTLTNQDSISN